MIQKNMQTAADVHHVFSTAGPALGFWELTPIVGILCLFADALLRKLSEAPLVPVRDPHMNDSLHYHA